MSPTQPLSAAKLENALKASTKGFFEDAGIEQDLRITLRIVSEVYMFLVDSTDPPNASELSYVMGTIQSGVDEFFQLAHTCESLKAWRRVGRLSHRYGEASRMQRAHF
jgi:hypothetical protein